MRFILLLLILLSVSLNGNAQNEIGGKSFKIAPIKNPKKAEVKNTPATRFPSMNFPEIKPPSSSFNNPTPSTIKQIGETSQMAMTPSQDFKNPNDIHRKNLNEKLYIENLSITKGDKHLGDLKTKSTYVNIHFWDFGEIDGDIVNIYINGALMASNVILTANHKSLELHLQKGFNNIEIYALNQGYSGANTAEIQVYDEKNILIFDNIWGLLEGYKATVIIVKE